MRLAAKIDANHKEVVKAFRDFGCSVLPMHTLGHGAPDIAVGKNKKTIFVEIKDGRKCPSEQALTKDEEKFHDKWLGSLFIVKDLGDVIALVRALER